MSRVVPPKLPEGMMRKHLKKKVLEVLTFRERQILIMRFGLSEEEAVSRLACAIAFSTTPIRIAGFERRAMRKLKALWDSLD